MMAARPYRPWTTTEIRILRAQHYLGIPALAQLLGRSQKSVGHKLYELRLSGRRQGTRAGRPSALDLAAIAEAERLGLCPDRVRAVAAAIEATSELCPSCGHRAPLIERLGICTTCHYRRLEADALQRAEAIRSRARDAAREVQRESEAEAAYRAAKMATSRARKEVLSAD